MLFVDTNIYLDLYRLPSRDSATSQLNLLYGVKEHLISTYQVEMEYKKNRQRVIINHVGKYKSSLVELKQQSPLIIDTQVGQSLRKSVDQIESYSKKVQNTLSKVLTNPSQNDPIYRSLKKIFSHVSPYNLTRVNEELYACRFKVRELAEKRYKLGYPPRKRDDTSIGDAVNWEWIIDCAVRAKTDVVIVSRDADFGEKYEKQMYINDWLQEEFRARVGARRKVTLTDSLMEALKALKVKVSQSDKQAEDEVLQTYGNRA